MLDEEKEELYVPRRVKSDTTDVGDSVPITFSVSVEGWEEIAINDYVVKNDNEG